MQKIREAGHSKAYLEATLTAEKFYQHHGFRKIGEGTFSRGNSPVSIEIIKMERALQANASPIHNHRQPGTEIVCLAACAMIDFQ